MTSPLDLALGHAGVEPGGKRHLERLMATWNLLADLCFSDLLLYVPTDRLAVGDEGPNTHYVVIGQMRPTTNPTLFEIDLVGQVVAASELPLVVEAIRTGKVTNGEQAQRGGRRSPPHRVHPGPLLRPATRGDVPGMGAVHAAAERLARARLPRPVRAFLGHGERRVVSLRRRRAAR